MATAPLPVLDAPQQPASPSFSWRPILVGALFALPALPLLVLHGRQLWLREHYQFFPLVLVGAGFLTYLRCQDLGPLTPGRKGPTYLLLGIVWLLLAAAGLLCSPWLGTIATLLLAAAVIYAIGGGRLFRRLFGVWAFLWLIVPPPLNLDQRLVTSLQTRTAHASSKVLDLIGVFHVMDGNVVAVPHKRLMVEEACSGINSLFAILACTWFFVLWSQRPWVRAILLVVAAVGWVLLANVVRVVGIAYLFTHWHVSLVDGWKHEVFGATLFTIILCLLWSTDRLLAFLDPLAWFRRRDPLKEASRAAAASGSAEPTRFPEMRKVGLSAWPVAGAFAALGVVQLALLWPAAATASLSDEALVQRLGTVGEDALPARWEQWQRQRFDTEHRDRSSEVGEYSRIWRYRRGHLNGIVSVDYPFAGWHELAVCYKSQGWSLDSRTVHPAERTNAGSRDPFVELHLSKPLELHGCVLFGLVDEQGRVLDPAAEAPGVIRLADRLTALRGLGRTLGEEGVVAPGIDQPSYQVQLFVESFTPLTPAEEAQARAFYQEIWRLLRQKGSNREETQR